MNVFETKLGYDLADLLKEQLIKQAHSQKRIQEVELIQGDGYVVDCINKYLSENRDDNPEVKMIQATGNNNCYFIVLERDDNSKKGK